jgi:hypothetical protein
MRPEASFPALRAALFPLGAALVLAAALPVGAQNTVPAADAGSAAAGPAASPVAMTQADTAAPAVPALIQPLLDFRPAEIKFSLPDLMDLLRDRRHEGWVLAAYPDPKTGRPLIGAGFSLDLPEREHAQTDPLNPHAFVEPSSAALWQAAGLDPALLEQVLDQFKKELAVWRTTRRYRRRIWSLAPQITDDQADALLRIAAIQAIENARAWCRDFDELSGSQQMAVSQLVYQMGVNLGEFSQFLALINNDPLPTSPLADPGSEPRIEPHAEVTAADTEYWRDVQRSLMQSQWARLYRVRAVAVIAMLDPRYLDDPAASEARIAAILHPVRHRRQGRYKATLRTASYRRRSGRTFARKTARRAVKRKA